MPFTPHWTPLEQLACLEPSIELGHWMFMGTYKLKSGVVIYTYKHRDTRNYLNLSDDLKAWTYLAYHEGASAYVQCGLIEAIQHALQASNCSAQ